MRSNPLNLSNLVSALDQTTQTQQNLSAQLSSGVRVSTISADPVAAGQNVRLSAALSQDAVFLNSESSATGMLQVTDTALGSVVSQLNSAVSLATQANNGALSSDNRIAISQQLAGVRDEVLSLANSSYQGRYIFAGGNTGVQPFTLDTSTTPATVSYKGDSDSTSMLLPSGQQVQLNVPGDQIFTSPKGNLLQTLNNLVADFSSGTPSAMAAGDTTQLTQALGALSQQRVVIDNSITRLASTDTYVQSQQAQLTTQRTNLLQADVAQVATSLSLASTQQSALTHVIAQLEQQGNLFSMLR